MRCPICTNSAAGAGISWFERIKAFATKNYIPIGKYQAKTKALQKAHDPDNDRRPVGFISIFIITALP